MTNRRSPDRVAAAVGLLAANMCDRDLLKAAVIQAARESLSLGNPRLVRADAPPAEPVVLPLEPGHWLVSDTPSDLPGPYVESFAAAAGAMLKQAARCELTTGEYNAVLAKLEELRRDLDHAHRNEWIAAERIRIAQDLHDRVAQTLFGLGLTTDWLLAHVEEEEPLRPDLERLKHLASTALGQVREAIFSLSSPPVEPAQFRGAIHGLLNDLESTGISGHLQVWGSVSKLTPDLTDGLYQVVREALVNVRRHSGASSVLVSIRIQNGLVTAVVQDDGKGLEPYVMETYRKNGSHLGLRGMESRIERLGGRFVLAPGDECGLIVTATIPLRGVVTDG